MGEKKHQDIPEPVKRLDSEERDVPISGAKEPKHSTSKHSSKGNRNHHHHNHNSDKLTNHNKEERPMTASERALAAVTVPIPCDECGEHIDAKHFIKHLKSCKGKEPRRSPPSVAIAPTHNRSRADRSPTPAKKATTAATDDSDKRSRATDSPLSPKSNGDDVGGADGAAADANGSEKGDGNNGSPQQSGSGGFINALENLIERSFGAKAKNKNQTTGILQRLGIDEEACPPWQHMAGQVGFGLAGHPFQAFHPWAAPGRERRSSSPSGTSSDFAGEENGSPAS